MTEVAVVGDALLDVVASPTRAIRPGADVPAAIGIGPGGQGANVAVRLARQGVRVELVCALGDDAAATLIRDALHAEGIAVSAVPVAATGTVVILLGDHGERTMLSHRAPFAGEAARAMPPDPDWIVVSGYLLLETDALELARSLASRASRRLLLGCAMPDHASAAGWMSAATVMRPDILVLNGAEAREIEPRTGLGAGVVTTSARGARATVAGVSAAARAPAGEPAIDTTGAGDAFAAGLIASLARVDWPPTASALEAALGEAAVLASSVARTLGALGRVPGEPSATLRR